MVTIPVNTSGNNKSPSRHSPTIDGDGQLDLLASCRSLLASSDNINFSSESSYLSPMSFEVPFDDLRLEPRPFQHGSCTVTCPSFVNPRHQKQGATGLAPSPHRTTRNQDGDDGGDEDTPEPITYGEPSKRFSSSQEKAWVAKYQRLLQFRNKFGHCGVPLSYPDDPMLGRWTKRQRIEYKKLKNGDQTSTMTPRRLELLESVEFVWCAQAAAWLEKLNDLKDFKQNKGHCNVPSIYYENQTLSTWVKSQRRQYKHYISGRRSTMKMDRFRELLSLGFVFEPRRKGRTARGE